MIVSVVCIHVVEANGGGTQREAIRLRKQNQQLVEENNLLKIKLELLLDMVSNSFFLQYIRLVLLYIWSFFIGYIQ